MQAKRFSSPTILNALSAEEARERLERFFASAMDCVISIDESGSILEFNPAAERLFNKTSAEAIGMPLAEMIIPPEYRQRHEEGLKRNLAGGGELQSAGRRMELEAMRPDGTRFPCELTLMRQTLKSGKVIFTAFLRDITERRKQEERFRAHAVALEAEVEERTHDLERAVIELETAKEQLEKAQEIARLGDTVYFPQSGLRFWSKQTFCIYGLKPSDKAPTDQQILAAIYPRDLRTNRKAIERTLFTLDPDPEIEFRVVHPDGAHHWLRTVSLVEKSKSGGNSSTVSTVQDITRQKAAEQEMLKIIEKERELGQLKSDFLNMITHEYRTPLGIINSSADILARYHDRLDESDRLGRIADIKHSTRRLADLVEEVLFFGKSESGKMSINLKPIQFDKIARDTAEAIVSHLGFPREVNIEAENLKEGYRSDEQLVRHILNNAISNALKYSTLDKPIHITIIGEEVGVKIAVRDEGIGIPEEDLKKVFTMFHRAGNVGTVSGTGLGLVILKKCVDHLGGHVSIRSELGIGTELEIILPENIAS